MAFISAVGDSYTVGMSTVTLTTTVTALDALVTADTSGVLNGGTYHVANSTPLHILFSTAGTSATAANTLLMAGERIITIPSGMKASVIKSAGAVDGIIRLTQVG